MDCRKFGLTIAASVALFLALPAAADGPAAAPPVKALQGALPTTPAYGSDWKAVGGGSGGWFIYNDGKKAPDPAQSDPLAPFDVPDPPQGEFPAVTELSGLGTRILYRGGKPAGREGQGAGGARAPRPPGGDPPHPEAGARPPPGPPSAPWPLRCRWRDPRGRGC